MDAIIRNYRRLDASDGDDVTLNLTRTRAICSLTAPDRLTSVLGVAQCLQCAVGSQSLQCYYNCVTASVIA
jgi:hypothetical protein